MFERMVMTSYVRCCLQALPEGAQRKSVTAKVFGRDTPINVADTRAGQQRHCERL
jgi:hypothetical protein